MSQNKNLLLSWLIDRTASDLKLLQALAASETQEVEKAQLNKKQDSTQASDSAIKELEESLSQKIHDLQNQLKDKEGSLESRDTQLMDFNPELHALRERMTQLAANEAMRFDQITERLKTEMLELKTQITIQARDSITKGLQESMSTLLSQMSKPQTVVSQSDLDEKIGSLQLLLYEQEALFARREASFKEVAATLTSKVHELENQLKGQESLLQGHDKETGTKQGPAQEAIASTAKISYNAFSEANKSGSKSG